MLETLLAGVGVSVFMELVKFLQKKLGDEGAKLVIVAGALVVSVVVALAVRFTPEHVLVEALAIWSSAITFYEAITKRLIKPALGL